MEKQKLIYVESKAQFSPSSVSNKAIVFIKDTKEIWTHGTYFICSNVWATPITLTLSGDSTGSVSIDGSGNVTLQVSNNFLTGKGSYSDANNAVEKSSYKLSYYPVFLNNSTHLFPSVNNANAILTLNTHDYTYNHQLGFSSNKGIYHRTRNAGNWDSSWEKLLTSTNYTNYPHTFASLTNKPTTISGYGITDSIPIIKGGKVTTDTDLSTLGMTATGEKLSIFDQSEGPYPSWLNVSYMTVLMYHSRADYYGAIGIQMMGQNPIVQFIGGRSAETSTNNTPNWWFRIKGTNGQTYNLSTIQTTINNLGSTYLPLTGGTLTDTLILKAGAFTASNGNSYSGGRYQAVAKPNMRLIGDSTYGLSTIEFTSQKGDTSINKPSDSGFIQFQPYGVSALSSVGSHPTLKTSGETNALVLGVTNDADDIIVLQSPNVSGLRHACGATEYYLPHVTTSTTTANKPLVSTTTAHVYTLGNAITATASTDLSRFVYATSSSYNTLGTTDATGGSSSLTRTQFWRDNNRAKIGVFVSHSESANYGFELASSYGNDAALTYRRKFSGSWETERVVLTNGNYTSYLNNTYLPLSGGVMTGTLTLKGGVYTDAANTGALNANNSNIYGLNSLYFADASETAAEGINFYRSSTTVDSLWGSNGNLYWTPNRTYGNAGTNYYVLTSNNYTNYTIPYSNSNVTNGALGAFIHNGNLQYNNNFKYLTFFPSDNLGNVSYVLIAKIDNWANTANATSSISYGINGLFIAYRGGNMANTGSYFVTNVAYVNTNYRNYKLYFSEARSYLLIPQLVIYQDEYYLAFKKEGSSTDYHFYGQVFNILPSFIYINDTSLITLVSGPSETATTGLYYYNNGNGFKKFLHEGNYSNYALPLKGGTLTGILRSTQVAGNLGTSPIACTGNVASTAGINNTYSHLASNLATGGALQIFIGKTSSKYNGGSIGYWHKGGDGSSGNALTFSLHSANNLMVIQGNGNVGINNTSPSYKLDVGGDIYSSGYIRAKSGFIKTDSSDSYVLLGGGGHKLLSDLSSAHTHDWSSITSKPSLLGAMAKPIFYPYAANSKLWAYISTINNRFYSADLRYTVTTTNFISGSVLHYLFDDNYDSSMRINMGTTATITIEGYNFIYNNGYIILYFYLDGNFPLLLPKSVTVVATNQNGTTYTLNRAPSVETPSTMAFSIDLIYLTKLEITIVSQDAAYCGITNVDYYSWRTENTVRDCAVVTKYNANTLYHNLTAPKYIVKNGTSSQFLKADGSLDSTAYLPLSGGTMSANGYIAFPEAANSSVLSNSTPMGITYSRIQCYGTLTIAGDTDASKTEFVNIVAGRNISQATAANGLSIGYNTLKWQGTDISLSGHNHDTSYLKLFGGTLGSSSASVTELRTQSSTAALRIMSYSDSINYIQSGNSSFDGNATLKITGYSNVTGTNLYFKFSNIYCRGNDYINIDSGNYNSYSLPLSGGTLTGALNTANIYPKANAGFNIGSTSSYYNTMYAYFFKKYGSDDNYLLLGGGGHKRVSDFPQIQNKGIEGGSSGNTDNWVLVLNNNYSTGWYGPCTMFYIRSKNFGCGILCFYHYWNTEGTSGYYDNSIWFFGAEHSAYSGTMGGTGRDINNYLKVYIDKENADLKIYYNRYNNQALNVQELQFVHGPSGTLYPSGELRASHFINSTQVVELPTTSNTFVNIPIQTVKNHTEDIKTTRSVYASAFYENSDIRLKENIHSIDQIDLLKNVDLVQFNFKNDQNKKYGVIAQQLEQVGLNNLVYEHNGNKAVDYISLLVLETQRLRNEIKELKEKLDKKELSS